MNSEKKYALKNLYIGSTTKYPLCLFNEQNNIYGIVLAINATGHFVEEAETIIDKRIKCSFKDYLNENNLDVLLCGPDGADRQVLTFEEIERILKLMRLQDKLDTKTVEQMKLNSFKSACQIADLLGMNVKAKPNSKITVDRTEVIVKASKMPIFLNTLKEYIYCFLLEGHGPLQLSITNEYEVRDYRIVRSLRKANIEVTEGIKNNKFNVMINGYGEIVKTDLLQEQQKVYKF